MDMEQIKNMSKEEAQQLVKDIIREKTLSPTDIGPWVFESSLRCAQDDRDRAVRTAKTMWEYIKDNAGTEEAERWLQDNVDPLDMDVCGIKLQLYSVYTVEFRKELQVCVPNTYDEDQVYEYVMEELSFDTNDLDYEVCEDCSDMTRADVEDRYHYNLENRPSDFEPEDWNL